MLFNWTKQDKNYFKPASLQIILAAFEQTMSGKISRNLPDQI